MTLAGTEPLPAGSALRFAWFCSLEFARLLAPFALHLHYLLTLVYVQGCRNLPCPHFDFEPGELRPLQHKGGYTGAYERRRGFAGIYTERASYSSLLVNFLPSIGFFLFTTARIGVFLQ